MAIGKAPLPLAEPLAALSVATDLARGRPPEEAARACLAALALADSLGLSPTERETVYWTTLLRSIGCTATSHEYAANLGGDDIAVRYAADQSDLTSPRQALAFLSGLTSGEPLPRRIVRTGAVAIRARTVAREGARADCEVGAQLATRCGLGPEVAVAFLDVFERWDGKGFPHGRRGEDIAPAARIAAVAHAAVSATDPVATVSAWSARALDPASAAAFLADRATVIDSASVKDPISVVAAAQPSPSTVSDTRLDEIALAFADAADLKAPFLHGHSRGVATLAEAAGRRLELGADEVRALRRASLLHDLGRVAVSTGTWEKRGSLSPLEWEAVRLHAYHGERLLLRSRALEPLALTVGQHHERVDGSGYHRGARGSDLRWPARILAAADVYQALTEPRPHRAAFEPEEAAAVLSREPLDPRAVSAVLSAAGQRAPRRPSYPAGLTEREVEVLGLLVRGLSKKDIAQELVISASTVHTHVVHIYEKAEVSTRAGAALFAIEHGLTKID